MTEPTIRTRKIPLRSGEGNIPVDLLLTSGAAAVNIRGTGIISLADAKYLLDILEDFIATGDDHEHAEAARAYHEAHPDEVSA
jgi:hypothetical protein